MADTPSGKRWEWVLGNRGRAAGCKVAKVESPFEKADLLVIALLVIAGLGGGMVSDFARKREKDVDFRCRLTNFGISWS